MTLTFSDSQHAGDRRRRSQSCTSAAVAEVGCLHLPEHIYIYRYGVNSTYESINIYSDIVKLPKFACLM